MKIRIKEDFGKVLKGQIFEATVNDEDPDYFIVKNDDETFTHYNRVGFDILPNEDPISLEDGMKDIISKKLSDGSIEKIIAEYMEKGMAKAMDNMIGYGGAITKLLEEKMKEVMLPYLASYDYSKYIVNVDAVMTEVLKTCCADNVAILTNFKDLMSVDDIKDIKMSDIYQKWQDYVSKNISTSELEAMYDDGPYYSNADVRMTFEEEEKTRYSSPFMYGVITFECDQDEDMNLDLRIYRYDRDPKDIWTISSDATKIHDIRSLKRLSEIEIFVMKLSQCSAKILLDTEHEMDKVEIEATPEASFS